MRDKINKFFVSGIQNLVSDEIIASDAASSSMSWRTKDGRIELVRGRQEYGENTANAELMTEASDNLTTEAGAIFILDQSEASAAAVGATYAQIFAPRQDSLRVHFRKVNTKIQVYDATSEEWRDVIIGLTADSDVFFAPYASLAGNYVFIGCQDGLYKINLANPYSFKDMYDSTKNHKGYIFINEARMFLWNRFDTPGDQTAIYLSKIDPQGTNYTAVVNENIGASGGTVYTGTLSQATGLRFVFGLNITGTTAAGIETFTDNQNGGLTSDKGGTGTIDYSTGIYSITFNAAISAGNVEADYQYENSNTNGITDFTFSAPRLAGEGDFIPQEYLGEPIRNVIPFDGRYYSFKPTCVYELDLTSDDTNATNAVFRSDIGVKSLRGVVATSKGIAYIDTANPDKPLLSMLVRNPVGGNLEPMNMTPFFAWENYLFDQCIMDTWGEYILVSCRTKDSDSNNRLILVNTSQKYSVDVTYYGVRSLAKNEGLLFGGGALSEVVYQLFTENDDLGSVIDNYWISKNENFGNDLLKKVRYLELKGIIDPNQSFEVYASFDNDTQQLIGAVLGSGDYVDLSNPQFIETDLSTSSETGLIGGDTVGSSALGGGLGTTPTGDSIIAFPFYTRMKIRTPKFRIRRLIFISLGYGYCGIDMIKDFDILAFEQRIPARFRIKRYVSLDGTTTDLPTQP